MNGATEATLQELLLVANRMNINLEKFTSQVGSSAGGGGGGLAGLASVAKFAGPAGVALGVLEGAAGVVGAAFNMLGNILGKVVTGFIDTGVNMFNFAKQAAMSGAKLSDFYAIFKDLPFGLGTVASMFSGIIKISEDLLGVYQNLSRTGASFGGDLLVMRAAAARSGLSMQEFASVIGSNSQIFATMGFDVQAGINKFSQASGALLGPKSKLSQDILGLGVTSAEAAGYLASVIAQQGVMGKKNALTADELAQKTHDYIIELDGLSKLTGIEREALDKKLKDLANDQQYQLFRDRLPKQGQEMLDSLQKIGAALGPGAEDAIKFGAQGMIAPMTKAGEAFNITSGGMYAEIATMARKLVKEGGYTTEQATKIIMDKFNVAGGRIQKFADGMGDTGSLANAEMLNAVGPFIKLSRTANQSNMTMYEALQNAKRIQEAQFQGSAAALAQTEQNIKNFGNEIMGFVSVLIQPITDRLVSWGKALTGGLTDETGKLKPMFQSIINFMDTAIMPVLDDVAKWLTDTFKILGSATDVKDFWEKFKVRTAEGIHNVWQFVKPIVVDMFSALFKAMKEALRETLVGPEVTTENQAQFEEQNDINKSVMTKGERFSTFFAEGIEGIAGLFSESFAKSLAAGRIQSQTEAGLKEKRLTADQVVAPGLSVGVKPEGKASGGPVNPGTYLVGEKGPELITTGDSGNVITNENVSEMLNKLAESGTINNNLLLAMQMLNKQTAQVLASMQETADYTRRNNDALRFMTGDAFA